MNLRRLVPELRIPLAVFVCCLGIGVASADMAPLAGGEPVKAWAQLAYMVVAIGLSLLAGELLKKDNQIRDDKPTVLATRGSFVPLLKGRQRLGYIFGWAGNRTNHDRVVAGAGKGLTEKARETAYNEDGWHLICLGEAHTLWEIDEGGLVLLIGPITRDAFPSGSTISLGARSGDLRIFWGENTQPVNTYLGAADRVDVTSRWPGLCYIEWRGKALGTAKTWPQLTYVFESGPQVNHLSHTPQTIVQAKVGVGPEMFHYDPNYDADGNLISFNPWDWTPFGAGPNVAGAGEIFLKVAAPVQWVPSSQVDGLVLLRWIGNADPATNKFYEANAAVVTGAAVKGSTYYTTYTLVPPQVIPLTATVSGPGTGYVEIWIDGLDGGWNGVHLVASLLFDPWPSGIAQDKSRWNLQSFEDFAAILTTEDIRCAIKATEGKDVRALLGSLMQDLGFTISLNPRTALLEIVPWRLPVAPLPNIPVEGMVRRPRKRLVLGPRKVDRLVFAFDDETNAFRDMTIHVDDDGQATRKEFYNQQVVAIVATSHYLSAARIAQRRAAEEMAKAHVFRVYSNRAARALLPGQAIVVEGFDEVMRVTAVKFDPLSGEVELALMNDFYGATINDFIQPIGKRIGSGGFTPGDRPLNIMIEMPEVLTGPNGPQTVLLYSIRPHQGIGSHQMNISRDGITYTDVGSDPSIVTGGWMEDAASGISADGEWLIDEGPTFTVAGDDIADVLDLSADLTSWRNGRQLALLVDAAGNQEICYLKKVTFISGDTYRLDGLIRARYDTDPISVPAAADAIVVIVQNTEGVPIQDVLLEPNVTLYGKSVAEGGSIATSFQVEIDLYGKGVRPLPVRNVRLDLGSGVVGTGTAGRTDFEYLVTGAAPADDLLITWGYRTPQSPNTGAGDFAAGNIQLDPTPEGDFIVEILDSGDVVVRTDSTATNSYTYTRADRIADFTSEPTLFKVRVTQTRGGQLADSVTQTISKM